MSFFLPFASSSALLASTPSVLAGLAAIVGLVFWLDSQPIGKRLFKYMPALVWVYFLPMLATSIGIFPQSCPLYGAFKNFILPASLLVLLATTDLTKVHKAGPPAIFMFFAGSIGIIAGAVISLFLLIHVFPIGSLDPDDLWRGFGSLSGSWIGGSANLVTLKGVFKPSENLFGQLVVVDTVVGYTWVGFLIAMASRQGAFSRWIKANDSLLTKTRESIRSIKKEKGKPLSLADAAGIVALGITGGILCMKIGALLPEYEGIVNSFAWGILIVSIAGVLLSFTPVRNLQRCGGHQLAYAGIYLMLAGVGARADLRALLSMPQLIAAGAIWIAIHGLVLLFAARLIRAPLFFLAVGSTANIGGPASAPLVATVYRPELAPVGLLLAVLGNTVGYYLGYLCGKLCSLVAGG